MIDTNWIEGTWTGVAIAGLIVQAFLIVNAYLDMRALDGFPPARNGRRVLALAHITNGLLLLLVHGCFVTLGVRAILTLDRPAPITSAYLIPVGLFMAASVTLVCIGLNEFRVRRKLRQARKEYRSAASAADRVGA